MARFFVPPPNFEHNYAKIRGDDYNHLVHVLRKKPGDEVVLLNGQGQEHVAVIREVTPNEVLLELTKALSGSREPQIKIKLVQSLPKADKFEFILQKNTELGVTAFQPLITERSLIKIDQQNRQKKQERWQNIIKNAAQQAGRQIIPELLEVLTWREYLGRSKPQLLILPWEGERAVSLKKLLDTEAQIPEQVELLIGPEGGFSAAEIAAAREMGAKTITLGPRILRTETAALVAATGILYHYDQLAF